MPYVVSSGVRIHYQVEGKGTPLVLQHGFSQSIEDWYEFGYVAALKDQHRLVLIDGRGHGRSDKPHEQTAYTVERRVADVVSVLDALGVERSHFWGYSWGAHTGFGMVRHAPLRMLSLVAGGQAPSAKDRSAMRSAILATLPGGRDAYMALLDKFMGSIPSGYATRLRDADHEAFAAAMVNEPSMEDILPGLSIPCLLYAGDADATHSPAQLAAQQMPSAQFLSLPSLNHMPAFYQSNKVIPDVLEFLRGVERGER